MTVDEAMREMRTGNAQHLEWADAVEQEREQLRGLLTRVLAAEGRCPTKLLHEISRVLGAKA